MNNLESKIYRQILKSEGIEEKAYEEANPISAGICKLHAIHAAGIAMKFIDQALSYGYHTAKDEAKGIPSIGYGTRFRELAGLTTTEPDHHFQDAKKVSEDLDVKFFNAVIGSKTV